MFHPIYNADGSLSRFRIVCLCITVVCCIAYALIVLLSPDGTDDAAYEEQTAEPDAAALKSRSKALTELADGFAFLKACDSINNGLGGCTWVVSDELDRVYAHEVKVVKDSFVLSLSLKNKNSSDICARLFLTSQGKYKAEDINGVDITAKCFPEDFVIPNFKSSKN